MYKSQGQNNRRRSYQVKKTGIKDENIDRQILVIHRAIAIKLVADHQGQGELIASVKAKLEQRREQGRMGYGEYLTWLSALEIIADTDAFIAAVCEDSARMRKFRRRTPFVGILTEPERQAALEADSLGTLNNLSNLL